MKNPDMIESKQINRLYEFDMAKTIAIILMIWTHTYEYLSTGFFPSASYTVTYIIGSIWLATTFMFCMGTGMAYTRHDSAEEFLHRGFNLLTIGFALLFFRETVPMLISWIFYPDFPDIQGLILSVAADILEFAGLAYILVGLLKKCGIGRTGVLLISIFLSIAGTLLEGVQTGNYGIDQFLGFFWGTYSESYFPLFNWFIFVAAGQWFGEKYQDLKNKNRFHLISLLAGSAICVAYLFISFNVEQDISSKG